MANSPFIDLKDEVALRRFLSDLHSSVTTTQILLQQTGLASDNLKLMSRAEIKKKIQDSVKEFDNSMWSTIDEVTTNLKLLIPSDGDIVKTIEDELAINTSTLTTDVKNTAVVAIAEDGSWATAQSVNDVSSNLATNYSTSSQTAATYATKTAVGAIYEVNVEANGHVSGYRAVATGSTPSIFQIYAEKFAISSSSTQEGYSPFQVDTANHKINMTSNVAIDGSLLISGSITAPAIAANTITTNEIAANTITASNIAANTITASNIAANTITTNEIAANTITASDIASNTITANQMNVSTLSAISANMGTITAGSITADLITAGTIAVGRLPGLSVQNMDQRTSSITLSHTNTVSSWYPGVTTATTPGNNNWVNVTSFSHTKSSAKVRLSANLSLYGQTNTSNYSSSGYLWVRVLRNSTEIFKSFLGQARTISLFPQGGSRTAFEIVDNSATPGTYTYKLQLVVSDLYNQDTDWICKDAICTSFEIIV